MAMRKRGLVLAVLMLLVAIAAESQVIRSTRNLAPSAMGEAIGDLPMEPILLPIVTTEELSGGFGSRWVSMISITNTSATAITLDGIYTGCFSPSCPVPMLAPGATVYPRSTTVYPPYPGAILFVEGGRTGDLHVQLRVQDVSRAQSTWGTSIPVVPESGLFSSTITLSDIPVDPGFRHLLRIYGFPAGTPSTVTVRVYRVNPESSFADSALPDVMLAEFPVALVPHPDSAVPPSYAQLELDGLTSVHPGDRLRVSVTPQSGEKIWAFVSVTNNETQHFTVIAP